MKEGTRIPEGDGLTLHMKEGRRIPQGGGFTLHMKKWRLIPEGAGSPCRGNVPCCTITLRQSGEPLPGSRCCIEEKCRTVPVVPLFP